MNRNSKILIDINSFTKEQIARASLCKTAEELVELAKKAGIAITKEEAEVYLSELQDFELDKETLEKVAGGIDTCYAVDGCSWHM